MRDIPSYSVPEETGQFLAARHVRLWRSAMKDLIQALDFVLQQLKDWKANGTLTDRQYQILEDQYERRRKGIEEANSTGRQVATDPDLPPADECWSCGTGVSEQDTHCFNCGAPMRG